MNILIKPAEFTENDADRSREAINILQRLIGDERLTSEERTALGIVSSMLIRLTHFE